MAPTTSSHLISSTFAFTATATALIAAILLFGFCPASATDHIVGANHGWNQGINYTLWANNHTFYVGDLISFRYQKTMYNVFEVNKTGYDNCTTEGAFGNWSSGKDFIPLNKSQWYYFICGTGGCFNGMKVAVFVHNLPSPPHSNTTAHASKSEAGKALLTSPVNAIVRFVMVLALVLVWV